MTAGPAAGALLTIAPAALPFVDSDGPSVPSVPVNVSTILRMMPAPEGLIISIGMDLSRDDY